MNNLLLFFRQLLCLNLDKLKVDHRSEIVRQKAEKLIRQIKEYRRRGKLDLNLQNKAEFARVPFLEPPKPSGTA